MKVLDVTHEKETGGALAEKIHNEVKATQLFVAQELPDTLKVTREQFNSLSKSLNTTNYMNGMKQAGKTKKAHIFMTPSNAMDVVVVDKF